MDAHEKYQAALQRQKDARYVLDLAIAAGTETVYERQVWVDASRAADVARLNANAAARAALKDATAEGKI